MPRLDSKTCIVTGAGRGIGAAIAGALAAEGAAVIVTDRDETAAAAIATDIGGTAYRLDVGEEADWAALTEAHAPFDVLVNNAGITGFEAGAGRQDPEHATLDDWRRVHRVNLDGVFLGCRAAIRAMRQNGGSIINIASRSANIGVPAAAGYAASKAAVCSLTKSVALYCAAQGLDIRCNAILPGAVLTEMWEPMLGSDADRDARMAELVADTPLRRFTDPTEVAALAVLLASDEVPTLSGAELAIDGGLSAGSLGHQDR